MLRCLERETLQESKKRRRGTRKRSERERLSELSVRELQHIFDCNGRDAFGHGGFG